MSVPRIGVMCFGSRADIGTKVSKNPIEALKAFCTPVVVGGIITQAHQARRSSVEINGRELDATIMIATTVRTAIQMMVAGRTLTMPILIWVPEPETHALPSALQVVDTLREAGRQCKLVYGHPIDKVMAEISRFVRVAGAVKRLEQSRIGLMDYRVPQLISGGYNDRKLFMEFGVETIQIDALEILSTYRAVPRASVESFTSNLLSSIDLVDATKDDVERALRLYLALKEIARKYNLNSLAIKGYPEFYNTKTSATLACAILNDEGIISDYEGDVIAAVTMQILHFLTGKTVFLGEPYKINEKKGTLLFFHRSAPMSLARDGSRVKLCHPRMLMAVPFDFDAVTLARLGGMNLKKFHASIGEVIPSCQESEASSEIEVKLKVDPRTFLDKAIGNHYSIVSGIHLDDLRLFCELARIDISVT